MIILALPFLLALTAGCPFCVVHGTRIATPSGEVPIESIQIGDQVISQRDDGSRAIGRVIGRTAARTGSYLKIQVAGQPRPLKVTGTHPVATPEGWKRAANLTVADLVQTASGPKQIDSINVCSEPTRVYDLTVSPWDNFIADGVVVHNKSMLPPAQPRDLYGTWIGQSSHYWQRVYWLEFSPDATGFLAVSEDDLYRIEQWSIDKKGVLSGTMRPTGHGKADPRQVRGRAYPGTIVLKIEDVPWEWKRNVEIRFEREEDFLAELERQRHQAAELKERIRAARRSHRFPPQRMEGSMRDRSLLDGVRYETTPPR